MRIFKRPLSALLAFSIFVSTTVPQGLTAQAQVNYKAEVSSDKKIADVFNKFRYDMTVEWDQKDPYFKQHAEKELENSLNNLRANGVSETAILAYMQNKLLDENLKKDYSRLMSAMKTQNLSPEEASEKAMKFMEKNYEQGASFSGGSSRSYKVVAIVVGVIIVSVVTYLVVKHYKKRGDRVSADSTADTTTDTTTTDTSSETSTESSSESTSTESSETSSESSSESSTIGGEEASSEVSSEVSAEASVTTDVSSESSSESSSTGDVIE